MAGCDLFSGVPAGTVVGEVRFDGRPAPGITVTLQSGNGTVWTDVGTNGTAVTDASGQYRFENLKNGEYRVRFDVKPSLVSVGGTTIGPKQVGTWATNGIRLGMAGARLGSFDVSYNGLIYPESGKSNTYSATMPLPFHWSTHRNGTSYRVKIYDVSGGVTGTKPVWDSGATGAPVTTLDKPLAKGNYRWVVEIDGGGSGSGTTEPRNLDLDFRTPEPVDTGDSSGDES
ncbi:Cna protein B-type domain protein [compost metagenome]